MKISVVTSVLNEENRIGPYIDSLIKQKKKPYEIILVDGGSTDNTVKIIKSYMKREKRIKLLKERGRKKSPANARNIGWKKAKGDLILFLDADCIVGPNFFEIIEECVRRGGSKRNLSIAPSVISSVKEYLKRYYWYGKTMGEYIRRSPDDLKTALRFLLSLFLVIFLPLIIFEKTRIIYLMTFSTVFVYFVKQGISCFIKCKKVSFLFSVPLFLLLSSFSTGIGIIKGFLRWLHG